MSEHTQPAFPVSDSQARTDASHSSAWEYEQERLRERPKRIAYADPPYPGCAHLYADHPDFAGEVEERGGGRVMGDWDAPSPWYVYTFGGLAFAWLACLANDQWWWSLGLGIALLANGLGCLWMFAKAVELDA